MEVLDCFLVQEIYFNQFLVVLVVDLCLRVGRVLDLHHRDRSEQGPQRALLGYPGLLPPADHHRHPALPPALVRLARGTDSATTVKPQPS